MKLKKISISQTVLDVNFKFYVFIKELNSSTINLTETDISRFLEAYFVNQALSLAALKDVLVNIVDSYKPSDKKIALEALLLLIQTQQDMQSFFFAIKLLQIKPLLLAEAKLIETTELIGLQHIHQLSVQYDSMSKTRPYYTRVHGALLALMFFDKLDKQETAFIAESTVQYIESLLRDYKYLQTHGLAANQMFMLMFTESMNQSIVTSAGVSYEERIFSVLVSIGIPASSIQKLTDQQDRSTEFDFYFTLDNKTVGISAKRTLRERYKQFIKTAHTMHVDLMIQITLGLDLTEEKAKSIRQHGIYLFIADEIYMTRKYLRDMGGIYPASQLTLTTLKNLLA